MAFLAYLGALLCFLVATLLGFTILHGGHWAGWVALGLLLAALAGALGAREQAGTRLGL